METTNEKQIAYTPPTDPGDLYEHYNGQTAPQPIYLVLDEDGRARWGVSGEIGNGVPAHVYYGITQRWHINGCPTLDGYADIMAEIMPLLERAHAGHSTEWDGSNYHGVLNSDAQEAANLISQILDGYDGRQYSEVEACKWCEPIRPEAEGLIRQGLTDEQVLAGLGIDGGLDGDADSQWRIVGFEDWIATVRAEIDD